MNYKDSSRNHLRNASDAVEELKGNPDVPIQLKILTSVGLYLSMALVHALLYIAQTIQESRSYED
jgi:hypothetical protein